jgi:hypothetical protein
MAIKKDTLDGLLAERVLNSEIDDHLDGEAAAGKRNSATVIRRRGC